MFYAFTIGIIKMQLLHISALFKQSQFFSDIIN